MAEPRPGLLKALDLGHRWLGLLVFGQVLLWSIGGCLMAGLDFSDLYVDPPPKPLLLTQATLSPVQLQQRLQALEPGQQLLSLEVISLGGELAYLLSHAKGKTLLAADGRRLSPIPPGLAEKIARQGYTGSGQFKDIELLKSSSGNYYASGPVYRARFADEQQTEIYISPETGALLARRKAIWGLYNRMWEFHLMKYTPWPALNKMLLLVFALLNALVALTGFVKFFRWGYRLRPAPATLAENRR